MRLKITAAVATLAFLFSGVAWAQSSGITIERFTHRLDGVDRVFDVTVVNPGGDDLRVNGRLVVLDVYNTSPPISIPIQNVSLAAGHRETFSVVWSNAPFLGQVRTLLVLKDSNRASSVTSHDFWIVPWRLVLALAGALAVVLASFMIVHRLTHRLAKKAVKKGKPSAPAKNEKKPKKKKKRIPSGMVPYTVEYDDTVVTIAERFGVTWEDVVHANKLKPPYDLKEGKDIFIPKHDLLTAEKKES